YHRSYGYPLWTMLSVDNIYTWNGSVPRPDAIVTRSDEYAIDEDQTGVFASVRWSLLDTVSLITGARVIDWQRDEMSHNFSSGAVSREHREENGIVTPYLGLVYDFADNWSAYTSYTTIFNPQSYLDVNGRYIDPKEGENYELGLKSEFWDKRLTAALSIFEVHQDNLAVADGNALAPDGNQAYRAESGTKTRGFEIEVAGEILPLWQISASYSYAEIHDADDDRLVTQLPRDTFKLFTSYQIPALNNLKIGSSVRWQGDAYYEDAGPNGETFKQGSFTIVDLMAQYALNAETSLALNFNNIFDERYYTAIGTRGWYGTPRNITARMKYDF
ncbi:MAG: TonB-dependent receptor, partial [Methylophaga nitratireducenticrescens]